MSQQVIGIVGMGPIGTILGAYLARGGAKVYGVESSEVRLEQVNKNGLIVRGVADLDERADGCFATLKELAGVEGLSAVFLCTKTWAIKSVMERFVELQWPENMRIVAFMNGIGPEDALGEYIDKNRICRGIINFAANLTDEGVATMNWFNPPNLIGPATQRQSSWGPKIEELLTGVGLTTIQVSHYDMKKSAFFKTILNSALNALCAAHGLTMSRAMSLKHTRHMARRLVREGLTVAALVGYTYGEDALDRSVKYLEGGGNHYPSMWFDLKARRPTEIEFINGKIVKIGRMFNGVDCDLNIMFTSAMVTQEISNGSRSEDDVPGYLVNF